MEPEDLASLLNDYLTEMSTIVDAFGGTLTQFVGDGIMVVFGAPNRASDKENAVGAVNMALAMQKRMLELQEGWFVEGIETTFRVRMGINTGMVNVGNFGSPGRKTYCAIGTQTNLTFPHTARLNADVNLASTTSAGTLGIALGNVLDSVTLDVTLDAFEAAGQVRVLSAPKIVTQNNQTANIEQGTQIPVVTTTATEIEVQYVPASLSLQVTPQITAEDTVIMKVTVTNDQPSDTLSVGDTPAIVTERVDTQILVRSGTTAVIGGVYKLAESDSETGIPGLRRIPFLGWLFKNKQFQKSSSELLIFLTPKIINTI